MKRKVLKVALFVLFFIVYASSLSSQEGVREAQQRLRTYLLGLGYSEAEIIEREFLDLSYSSADLNYRGRIIENTSRQSSNQPDVWYLKRRLLVLGFYELINEFNGQYGRITENVIKNIQTFSGFEVDGRVNRDLWNYIFNRANDTFLENISTVLTYDPVRLEKRIIGVGDFGGEPGDYYREAVVYYSGDNIPKIIEYYHNTISTSKRLTCYFLDINNYFVQYEYVTPNPSDREEKIYYFSNNRLYEVRNGSYRFNALGYNIEEVNEILNIFRSAYR
jgi:peptidoglycan hydrolase-like protein with peptidoglycan-binding domain